MRAAVASVAVVAGAGAGAAAGAVDGAAAVAAAGRLVVGLGRTKGLAASGSGWLRRGRRGVGKPEEPRDTSGVSLGNVSSLIA